MSSDRAEGTPARASDGGPGGDHDQLATCPRAGGRRSADPLAAELADIVGPHHVLTDPELVASHQVDWTGRWRGRARLVVRPGSTDEVARVVIACGRAGAPIVPQGGNTGLVGGAVPRARAVVLSTRRLDALDPVDPIAGQVRAGAGAVLGRVQAAAREAGYDFGVDLASRDGATVGGMVATNAGGIHVLRYGAMRANVVGLEFVKADGSVVSRMAGLVKDNSGYDLAGLLVGSEGTLGVVTSVQLRLVPRCTERVVAAIPFAHLGEVVAVCGELRRRITDLLALEVVDARGTALVSEAAGLGILFDRPEPPPWTLLVESGSPTTSTEDLATLLADVVDSEDALVAVDPARRDALWAYRERLTESIARAGIAHKLDVTLPFHALARFETELRRRIGAAGSHLDPVLFGHLGDGNLHVNVLGADPDDDAVDELVLTLVADHGGSISAEHGIGVAKRRFLTLTRSAADIASMAGIKEAFDPDHLLNPDVLLP